MTFCFGENRHFQVGVDIQRQKRFITKANNTTRTKGGKQIAKDTKERFDALHTHIRGQALALVGGDVQAAYNYLVELVKRRQCAESSVWAMLDELILAVIPKKHIARRLPHEQFDLF